MFFKDSAYSGYKLAFTVLRAASATHKQFTMQAVAVAIAKAMWVRGKCEETNLTRAHSATLRLGRRAI